MPTDAATAVLITLRDRVQALHEAHVLVADSDPVSPEGASVLADAAARLGDVLAASSEVLDPARTEAVRSGVGHLGEFAEAVRAADAVADAAAAQLEEIPHALVVGPVGDRTRHEARERRRPWRRPPPRPRHRTCCTARTASWSPPDRAPGPDGPPVPRSARPPAPTSTPSPP